LTLLFVLRKAKITPADLFCRRGHFYFIVLDRYGTFIKIRKIINGIKPPRMRPSLGGFQHYQNLTLINYKSLILHDAKIKILLTLQEP